MKQPIGNLRVSVVESTFGVYKVEDNTLNLNTVIALSALETRFNYPTTIGCTDMNLLETPQCDNPIGIKIVFQDQCTTYENYQDFNKTIRFFRPCLKHDFIKYFPRHTGQPSICSIPLINGTISVYAAQLRDCIYNRTRNAPLIVEIESAPFTTYDLTMSENIILGLSNYVSANHCQDGSNISVHLCRNALNFPEDIHEITRRRWGYFGLEAPTRYNDALPESEDDEEDGLNESGATSSGSQREDDESNDNGPEEPQGRLQGEDGPDELSPLPFAVPTQASQTSTRDRMVKEFGRIFDGAGNDDES